MVSKIEFQLTQEQAEKAVEYATTKLSSLFFFVNSYSCRLVYPVMYDAMTGLNKLPITLLVRCAIFP